MGYVGRGLNQEGGQYRKLDDISSSFDGSETSFNLTVSNLAVTPTAQNLLISINGVIQEPGSAFSMNGSTITFTEAPAGAATFFGIVMGEASYIAYDTVGANELGVTAGTVKASRGVVVDSSKDVTGFNQVTSTTFSGIFSGALSSSAQIASDISGSENQTSASFSTRVTVTEASSSNINQDVKTSASPTFTTGTYTSDLGVSGSMTVKGSLTAQEFKTEFVSASIIYDSGSSKFGDTADDIHQMTGSLRVTGSGNHYIQTGNVGIGTTGPGAKLDIVDGSAYTRTDGGSLTLNQDGSTAPTIYLRTPDTSNRATRIYTHANNSTLEFATDSSRTDVLIDDSGNLGIGNTAPPQPLTVAGNISGSGNLDIDGNMTASGDAYFGSNVGIGTNNPTYDFQVEKSSENTTVDLLVKNSYNHVSSSARIMSYVNGASSGNPKIGLGVSGVRDYFFLIDNNDADKLKLQTNDSTKLTMDTSGKVGIGTTSPDTLLDVRKTGTATEPTMQVTNPLESSSGLNTVGFSATFLNTFNNANAHGVAIGSKHDDSYSLIIGQHDTTFNHFVVKGDGNVGIGTTGPLTPLHISHASNGQILLEEDNKMAFLQQSLWNSVMYFGAYHDGSNEVYGASSRGAFKMKIMHDGDASPQYMAFYGANAGSAGGTISWNTVGFAQDEDGNVGIGTTSPDELLEIQGSGTDATTLHVDSGGHVTLKLDAGSNTYNSQILFDEGDASKYAIYYQGNADSLVFYDHSGGSQDMTLKGGNVGIGTASPATTLHISASGGSYSADSTSMFINNAGSGRATFRNRSNADDASEIFFDIDGAIRWDLSARDTADNTIRLFPQAGTPSMTSVAASVFTFTQSGNLTIAGSYSPFTGTHLTVPASGSDKLSSVEHWSSSLDDYVGKIVVSSGTFIDYKYQSGSIAKTIDEAWPQIELTNVYKDKKVLGVVSGIEGNPFIENTAQNEVELRENGHRFIGVNSLGEGCIWISNLSGSLENGDYITSSPIEGYGMKQDDDLLHNYTVAKITENCDFSGNGHLTGSITHNNVTYKTAFVGCTYHCG